MDRIIGVQFQKNGKLYYFDANGFEVKTGDYVIVDTVRGYDLGEVIIGTRDIEEQGNKPALKKTVRIATEQDIQHARDNRQKEKEAFSVCQKKINEHKLEMKLVSVEYAFDNSKILFFFTANGRVDFRSLVKDLASIFKMRIELRQIGVRDEAKMLGGLGPCGRPICCGTFLDQFQPVSIKMAKEQNLSLNPTKISGVCGRLMCCLKYEQEHYEMTRKRMPKIGREVITPEGTGTVTDLNIVKETIFVRLTNGDTSEIKEFSIEDITRISDNHGNYESSTKNTEKESDETDKEICTMNQPKNSTETENDPISDEETAGIKKPADTSVPNKEKNKAKMKKRILGQPVRRENPNRSAGTDNNPKTKDEKTEIKDKPPIKSPWADALEKAMQAVSREK